MGLIVCGTIFIGWIRGAREFGLGFDFAFTPLGWSNLAVWAKCQPNCQQQGCLRQSDAGVGAALGRCTNPGSASWEHLQGFEQLNVQVEG